LFGFFILLRTKMNINAKKRVFINQKMHLFDTFTIITKENFKKRLITLNCDLNYCEMAFM